MKDALHRREWTLLREGMVRDVISGVSAIHVNDRQNTASVALSCALRPVQDSEACENSPPFVLGRVWAAQDWLQDRRVSLSRYIDFVVTSLHCI